MISASINFREFGDQLLVKLLDFAAHSISGAVGAGLSIAVDLSRGTSCLGPAPDDAPAPPAGTPRTVAAVGVAVQLDPAQWASGSGPLWETFRTGRLIQVPSPIETATPHRDLDLDLGTVDGVPPPAPGRTEDLGLAVLPGIDAADFSAVRGAVFSAGEWGGELPVILSLYLDRPADARTLRDLDKYEPVITQALSVVEYCDGEQQVARQMLQMTQYRRVIEQAKGLAMGAAGGDANSAFAILVRASQHFNVPVRNLAVALVEHVGGGTAEHPDDPDLVIRPTENERKVAARVWAALTTTASLAPPSGA